MATNELGKERIIKLQEDIEKKYPVKLNRSAKPAMNLLEYPNKNIVSKKILNNISSLKKDLTISNKNNTILRNKINKYVNEILNLERKNTSEEYKSINIDVCIHILKEVLSNKSFIEKVLEEGKKDIRTVYNENLPE